MRSIVSLICALLVVLKVADGFASYMTRRHCEIPVEAGITIMDTVTEVSTEKSLRLFQGDTEILNGATVHSVKNLTVKLDPKSNEVVLEARGAKFERGFCEGTRSNTNGAKLIVKSGEINGLVEVSVLACWAKTYTGGVKIVPPFHFIYQPSTSQEAEADVSNRLEEL